MKVTLKTGEDLDLEMLVKLKGADYLWNMDLRRMGGKPVRISPGLQLTVTVDAAIPGRKPEEIEYFIARYGGMEFKIPPVFNKEGNIEPIAIYDGDKDYWTNVLRQRALEAP